MMRGRRFHEMLGNLPRAGWPAGMAIALFVVLMSGETLTPAKAGAQQLTPRHHHVGLANHPGRVRR